MTTTKPAELPNGRYVVIPRWFMGAMTLAWPVIAAVIGFTVPRALEWQERLVMLEAHDQYTVEVRNRAMIQVEHIAELLATHLQDTSIHAGSLGQIKTRLDGIDKQLDRIETTIRK